MTEKATLQIQDELSIVFGGEAGHGIQTIENVLGHVLRNCGYHVFSTSEFMSRIRGGSNSTEIRISSRPVNATVDRIDVLVAFDSASLVHLNKRISLDTLILGERSLLMTDREIVDVPLFGAAAEAGGKIMANSVAAGLACGLLDADEKILNGFLLNIFSKKKQELAEKNIQAARRGRELGRRLVESGIIRIHIAKSASAASEVLLNGAQAVGLGAVSGGCNFVSSYPMSPSTSVLTFLAQQQREFGIVVEQVEDEIAAVNMAIGAWYAGGRGLVTMSGGGFALMGEGISLSGMIETPVVVHVGQRPSPATGLPTRTEQTDLELVLYAGHGEFSRAVFAPGTLAEAVEITNHVFNLADQYQIPVFILTDQYFLDSHALTQTIDLTGLKRPSHFVRTDTNYRRYTLMDNGLSPRGIPGFGDGIVCVDSDEHTEEGYITEDADMRTRMVNKRLKRLEALRKEALPPSLIGGEAYRTLVVCWGSTVHAVGEAVERLRRDDVAILHFSQVYPLHEQSAFHLRKAKRVILVENNATSQFGKRLKLDTGFDARDAILKYDGSPFSVEEIHARLKSATGR